MREYPTPEPGAGEVRVHTLYSGISAGTEHRCTGAPTRIGEAMGCRGALFVPGEVTLSYPVGTWGYSEVGDIDAWATA